MDCWSLAWKILSITLLACEMSAVVRLGGSLSTLWHCPFLGLKWKLTFSSPCGHCWVFQICWHIECSPLTASFSRIQNSSAGISLPPLASFVVMLPKAQLTSDFRISSSRWVTTPSWLDIWVTKTFFYIVLLCILAISFQSVLFLLGPYCFCPLSCPSLHEMLPRYLQFSWRDL